MKPSQQRLVKLFQDLPQADRDSLLAFAEFLHQRAVPQAAPQAPVAIPRPPQETVVAAIKRLSKTYPMVDPASLLNETSALMAQHLMQGRSASEVIDELEALFRDRYNQDLDSGEQ